MAAANLLANVRTIVVEDQYFTAAGILKALGEEPRIKAVAHYLSAEAALESSILNTVDVALVDLGLPGMNGMELTRELLEKNRQMKIIWLTAYPLVEIAESAKAFGADAVLYKTCRPEELFETIFSVYGTGKQPAKELGCDPVMPMSQDEGIEHLSARQRQILSLVAQGFMTKEIAHRLALSPRTVESHRMEIMKRLNSENLADMTRIACRNGLVPL